MLRNVRVESKGPKPQFMEHRTYDMASDVTVWNLYEQTWSAIVAEGLGRLFENRDEFEQRKVKRSG
ncbi:hypothetical protein M3172_04915 [Mesobacillus subterraneus]|uniref:hypothetical protein n=1 Tax=Mesobacillus subterraneus TaxID=285983 RepID=UPI00203B5E44|nr:hypothetical protein [Mesobacillus subterraneus]MCM3572520.1 hypothetical protein [Mesobacillus subterraneus]